MLAVRRSLPAPTLRRVLQHFDCHRLTIGFGQANCGCSSSSKIPDEIASKLKTIDKKVAEKLKVGKEHVKTMEQKVAKKIEASKPKLKQIEKKIIEKADAGKNRLKFGIDRGLELSQQAIRTIVASNEFAVAKEYTVKVVHLSWKLFAKLWEVTPIYASRVRKFVKLSYDLWKSTAPKIDEATQTQTQCCKPEEAEAAVCCPKK